MADYTVFALKFLLWAAATLSLLGMTVVPLSLFVGVLLAKRKERKAQR